MHHQSRVLSYDVLQLKAKGHSAARIRSEQWFCPHCKGPVDPKLGLVRAWHFAHAKGQSSELAPE
ncbi:competence protein CoiA family protein [Deinococcus sp. SL84]|uniref:competence protein CoiA family protein n=1 Tax=Deinococcus sp. SL84 TaxID=2994663 RepID=UPI003FA366EA